MSEPSPEDYSGQENTTLHPTTLNEDDSPAEREKAWHEFKGTVTQAFNNHPNKVIERSDGSRELPLDNSDPEIDSLHLTIQLPGRPPSYLLTGNYLDIKYINGDRVVYEYTPDSEVIKWTTEREREGAVPTIPPIPSEDLSIAKQVASLKEITLRARERTRHMKESIANLRLAQKMGTNGQPASAPETRKAISMIKRG